MSVVLTPAALPSATLMKVVNPIVTSTVCTFEESYHRKMAYTTGPSSTCTIQVARQARFLACMRDSGLSVWRISPRRVTADIDVEENSACDPDWEKVVEMDLQVQTNLVATAISDNGQWIVASDFHDTKLFSLSTNVSVAGEWNMKDAEISYQAEGQIKIRRARDLASILSSHLPGDGSSTGGLAFQFTPDSSKLVMATAASAYILVIDLSSEKLNVLRRFGHHRLKTSLAGRRVMKGKTTNDTDRGMNSATTNEDDEDRLHPLPRILRLAISSDGQWLASSDDQLRTHVYNLDSLQVCLCAYNVA